ncbi:MAG: hypothetical protein IPK82_07465 [Polyangiaceae bacterium]|nr:hypothetical protein [Polyangiaceae bacterium]
MSEKVSSFGHEYLVHAVTGTAKNPILEQIKNQGAEVVLAVFRLVKIAIVHHIDNDAVTQTIERTHRMIVDFCATVGMNASVTFADDTVFVCGQLLRASRGTYGSALELAQLLEKCSISEVSFEAAVTPDDLKELALVLSIAIRDPARRTFAVDAPLMHMTLRRKDPVLTKRERPSALPLKDRIVRMYASALVVMRQFLMHVASGATVLPQRVKRLGQSIVSLSETGDPAMLGMTAMASTHRDDAGRAVHCAILAVVTARKITNDRLSLARLATSALMADVGRTLVAGSERYERLVKLSHDEEERIPAATSELCITTGGVNFPNALRTAITYETTWLERSEALGPVYDGIWTPLIQARLLAMVRKLVDLVAPRDTSDARSPLEALRMLAQDPEHDAVLLKALVRAVGVIPLGSVVELESRAWAVVIGESRNEMALDRPKIAIVTDPNGKTLPKPREVDLGADKGPAIVRVLGPSTAKFNVTRLFLAAPQKGDARLE